MTAQRLWMLLHHCIALLAMYTYPHLVKISRLTTLVHKFTWSLHEPISFQHISLQLDNIVNKHAILSIPFIHGHTAGLRRWPCINCVNLYQCVSYQTWSTTHSCTADATLPDTPSSPRYSAIEWFLTRNSWATLLTAYSAAPPRHKRSPFSWFFPKKVRKNSKICAMVLL